jgi:hypothetical protein
MQLRKRYLLVFLVLVGIAVPVAINSQKRQHSSINEEEILSSLNDGDIICRLGDRLWSAFFKDMSPVEKKFSHLGIIRIRDNVVSVINAEGLAIEGKDYVNEVPLRDFLGIAQNIGIYRLRTIDGDKISDAAMEFIGYPFDWQFNMDDDNKLYCTELLYVILNKLDANIKLNLFWLKEMGRYIIPLDICSQSEYFTEIGYWEKN